MSLDEIEDAQWVKKTRPEPRRLVLRALRWLGIFGGADIALWMLSCAIAKQTAGDNGLLVLIALFLSSMLLFIVIVRRALWRESRRRFFSVVARDIALVLVFQFALLCYALSDFPKAQVGFLRAPDGELAV
jgi:hypothetical protein